MIKEFRSYKWKEDRAGRITNVPEDLHNHTLDAARYSCYSILSKPNFGKYYIH
jgi:phage terminase large subunit